MIFKSVRSMTLPVFFFCFLSASPSPSVVVFVKRFLFWSKLVTLFRIISANGFATAQGKKPNFTQRQIWEEENSTKKYFFAISPELLNKHVRRREKTTRRSSVWKSFVSTEKFSITFKFMTLFCFQVRKRISRFDSYFSSSSLETDVIDGIIQLRCLFFAPQKV